MLVKKYVADQLIFQVNYIYRDKHKAIWPASSSGKLEGVCFS